MQNNLNKKIQEDQENPKQKKKYWIGILFYSTVVCIAAYMQFFHNKGNTESEYDRVMKMRSVQIAESQQKLKSARIDLKEVSHTFENENCDIKNAYLYIDVSINIDPIPLNKAADVSVKISKINNDLAKDTIGGHLDDKYSNIETPKSEKSSVYLYDMKNIKYKENYNSKTKDKGEDFTVYLGKGKTFKARTFVSYDGIRNVNKISIYYECENEEECKGQDFDLCGMKQKS